MLGNLYDHIRETPFAPLAVELYARSLPTIGDVAEFSSSEESVHIACRQGDAESLRESVLAGERKILNELINAADTRDVFWDIGAHLGIYSAFVGQKVREVVAFEPNAARRAILKQNLKRNGVPAELRDEFLGDGSGESVAADSIRVTKPTMLKMDIEGAELDALQGMERLLRDDPLRLVFVEMHPENAGIDSGLSPEECDLVWSLLEDAGFSVSEIDQREGQYFLHAEK